MNKNIILDTLEKIKNENIKPKPKWEFLLKSYMFWGAFGLTVILGSSAVSVIIFRSNMSDWDLYRLTGDNLASFVFKALPLFWILALLSLISISFYNIRHTKKGYKYNFGLLITFSIVLSLSLGYGMYAFGFGKNLENKLVEQLPFYRDYSYGHMYKMWSCSDCGLIAGRVEEIISPEKFVVIDLDNNRWTVITENLVRRRNVEINNGNLLKLIGEIISDNEFRAVEIRPWLLPHDKMRLRQPMPMMQYVK